MSQVSRRRISRLCEQVAAFVIMTVLRALVRLPTAWLIWLLTTVRRGADFVGAGNDVRAQLGDMLEVLRDDAAGHHTLRRLVLEARRSQLLSFLRGMLRHHMGLPHHHPDVAAPDGASLLPTETVSAEVTVGLVGAGFDLEQLGCEYGRRSECRVIRLGDDGHLPPGLDVLEIGPEVREPTEFAAGALEKGLAVSVHHSCLKSHRQLVRLLESARRGRAWLEVFYPYLHYAPLAYTMALLDAGEIGEVTTVRVRATLGRVGEATGTPPQDPPAYLAHAAFDHFLLLVCLGGAVEKFTAYLNRMDASAGGQGLLAVKYVHPGRYGLLECTFAPQLGLRTDHQPHELEVEIAGTDGIVWLQRGMAARVQAAPVRVRVGRISYSIGVESGLRDSWGHVYQAAVEQRLQRVTRKDGRGIMTEAEIIAAIRLRERVHECTGLSQVVTVAS